MRLILEIVSGSHAGEKIPVEEGQVVRLGRTSKADVATGDSYMSGEHFAVECDEETCRIRDLNSRNGTKLNGERITSADLHDGDRIFAGQTDFVVNIEGYAPTVVLTSVDQLPDTMPPGTPRPTEHISVESDGRSAPFGEPSASPAISVATPSPLADQLKTEIGPGEAPTTEPVPDVAPPADRATEKFSAAPPESPSPQTPEPQAEATLGDRLLQVLRRQPEPLFALLDATKQRQVLELLRSSGDEYQSLYEGEAFAAVAPYLVRLPAQSNFLLTMVRDGWGRDWGVFLTCSLPLTDLRSYFRQALMIKTADGQEFFSRFYAPSFFRGFLSGCTPAEADRFFGPVRRYLMEAERPETLLEFTKTAQGVEMKKLPV